MFYKKGEKWVVTKARKEIGQVDTKKEATLMHYEQVEPHLLEDYKAGRLSHKP